MSDPAPVCHGCRHLRITYDPAWPYACLRFAIRSRRLPAIEVEEASGEPCAAREARADPVTGHEPRPRGTA